MKLLLDTHAYIWWGLGDSKRFSMRARKAVEARAATIYVSAVSVYEMTYKHRAGDLPKVGPLIMRLDDDMAERGFFRCPSHSNTAAARANSQTITATPSTASSPRKPSSKTWRSSATMIS